MNLGNSTLMDGLGWDPGALYYALPARWPEEGMGGTTQVKLSRLSHPLHVGPHVSLYSAPPLRKSLWSGGSLFPVPMLLCFLLNEILLWAWLWKQRGKESCCLHIPPLRKGCQDLGAPCCETGGEGKHGEKRERLLYCTSLSHICFQKELQFLLPSVTGRAHLLLIF